MFTVILSRSPPIPAFPPVRIDPGLATVTIEDDDGQCNNSVVEKGSITLRLLLVTVSKFSDFCIFRVLILAILDQYSTMILMIFIVIDDVMFYSRGQILTIITYLLKFAKISTRL